MVEWFYRKWLIVKHFKEIMGVAKVLARGGMYSFRDSSDAFIELTIQDESRMEKKYGENVPEIISTMIKDAKVEKELRIRRGEWSL